MAKRNIDALTPEERGLLYRVERTEQFKNITVHLRAIREMIVSSSLDANDILCVFANGGISIWHQTVQGILAERSATEQAERQALSK